MQFLSEYTGRSVSDGWKNIPDAYQWKLKFGNKYVLSVINNGMGAEQGLYEIAVWEARTGNMTVLEGVTNSNESVKGFLSASEVDSIISYMSRTLHETPVEIRQGYRKRKLMIFDIETSSGFCYNVRVPRKKRNQYDLYNERSIVQPR